MGKTDVLVRMKADTTGYDANIAKARKQLERFGQENLSAGGMIKQMTGQLVGAAAKFASFGAAVAAAMKVAKDAFFNNEEQLDEWGRTVESVESIYKGFLNSINTGDISGFITRINQITQAARDAYDAMDALNTFNAFNQIQVEKTRTGMTESIVDYREGNGSKNAVRAAADAYKNELRERAKLEKQAYLEAVKKVAAERDVNAEDLRIALSGKYGSYQMLKNVQPTGSRIVNYGGGMFGAGGSYTVDVAVGRQEKLGAALRKINDDELKSLQAIGAQAERTAFEIANVDKQVVRVLRGKQGGSGGGSSSGGGKAEVKAVTGSIDEQTKKVQELEKAWRAEADDNSRLKIKKQIEEAQFALDIMMGKSSGMPGMNYGLGDLAGKGGSGLFQNPLFKQETNTWKPYPGTSNPWKLDDKAMKAVAEYYDKKTSKTEASLTKEVSNIASGITNVVGGIESLGVELPEGLKNVLNGIQGVISILTGISTIITAIEALTAADTIVPFARGGIVHAANGFVSGNSYSGDRIPAMLNAGELILNRAQQGVIADALQNNDGGGRGYTPSHVSGEQIWIALNAFTKRTGRGELVTWR